MIKKLQALKAKKGFTLVELIVVIAIIGVLAAILVPTMLGYVTSSRVTSSNTTASELSKAVQNFITEMDSTRGYTFDRAGSHQCIIKKEEGKDLTVDFSAKAFKSGTETDIEAACATKITNDFGFNKAYAIIFIENGRPVGCAYSPDGNDCSKTFKAADFTGDTKNFKGWTDTDGIASDGYIYGTDPVLTMPLNGAGGGSSAAATS